MVVLGVGLSVRFRVLREGPTIMLFVCMEIEKKGRLRKKGVKRLGCWK